MYKSIVQPNSLEFLKLQNWIQVVNDIHSALFFNGFLTVRKCSLPESENILDYIYY